MADKTTTLKTKTNDNVYPNIIGENRKDSFVDSSTITHHFYDQTHKVGFQIANATNIKIQNSLQKPAGLTKTKLVGVGANGQENIEIGDNLTLANGKLSASGGGSDKTIIADTSDSPEGTFSGTLDDDTTRVVISANGIPVSSRLLSVTAGGILGNCIVPVTWDNGLIDCYFLELSSDPNTFKAYSTQLRTTSALLEYFTHFITMKNSSSNIVLYLSIRNTNGTEFTADDLSFYLRGHKVLVNGNLHGSVPTYITREGDIIKVYYMTPGDNTIDVQPDEFQDLSSFTITDLVSLEE